MNFIVVDKKIEDALLLALSQIQKEIPFGIYKEIEKILLKSIENKQLSVIDINIILSMIDDSFISKKIDAEEDNNKPQSSKKHEIKKCKKLFDYNLYKHLYLVRLLNLYKVRTLNNTSKQKIKKR